MAWLSPTGVTLRSSSTLNNFTCKLAGVDSISSKKTVPPLANSNLPWRDCVAPVYAPLAAPKSSLSISCSGIAPQFMATKLAADLLL